jgi:hypothetical protein
MTKRFLTAVPTLIWLLAAAFAIGALIALT